MKVFFHASAVALATAVVSGCANSSLSWNGHRGPFPKGLAQRNVERRAVDAAVWGVPATNFELMLQATVATGASPNQVVYCHGRCFTIEDKSGHPFDRKKTYRLHVPPNAPVKL